MLICNFTRKDEEIEVEGLWQWDYGQKLCIRGIELPDVFEVHYEWSGIEETVLRVGNLIDGEYIVDIPNEALEQRRLLKAYIYVSTPTEGETVNKILLSIEKRQAPENFETPEGVDLFHHTLSVLDGYLEGSKENARQAEGYAHGREDIPERAKDNAAYYADQARLEGEKIPQRVEEAKSEIDSYIQRNIEPIRREVANNAQTVNAEMDETKRQAEAAETAKTGAETAKAGAEKALETITEDKNAALQEIATEKTEAINAIGNAGVTALNAIEGAGTAEIQAVTREGTAQRQSVIDTATEENRKIAEAGTAQTNAVSSEGAKQFKTVNDAGTAQTTAVNTAGETQTNAVNTAGTSKLSDINTAGEARINEINNTGTEKKQELIDEGYRQIQEIRNEGSLEKAIETYYALRRTGKVYKTRLHIFANNPTSIGEKLLDNTGLEYAPGTDTVQGIDYEDPLFQWTYCNYVREADGSPRPTALEGMKEYAEEGPVDVGSMQMSFWWNWERNVEEGYIDVSISDTPHPELGLVPWSECVTADGRVLPWCIGSAFLSGTAADGKLRSQPGLKIKNLMSHNSIITEYQKKGPGYWGAGSERNTFGTLFQVIKGATKNSQNLYYGCGNYNLQYEAAVQRKGNETYFPVTPAQAQNLVIGSRVSVGYAQNNNGSLNKDRGITSMHAYANMAQIKAIEDMPDGNKAIYLDIETGFSTMPVALTETLNSPIYISTMPWHAGTTKSVLGHCDGSMGSNTNGKFPYRVQGREYAVGTFFVAADTVMINQADCSKNVYVAQKGTPHSNNDTIIQNTYKLVGNIPGNAGNNYWVGDIDVDFETGAWWPSAVGNGSSQGFGDMVDVGGNATTGSRESLQTGNLYWASWTGSAFLSCWRWLSGGDWDFGSGD